jgi:hypothetical protein
MRNKNSTIKIKNKLPELLEAVCNHADCPEWLTDAIWDAFNNQHIAANYSATFWRAQLEAMFVPKTVDTLNAEVLER